MEKGGANTTPCVPGKKSNRDRTRPAILKGRKESQKSKWSGRKRGGNSPHKPERGEKSSRRQSERGKGRGRSFSRRKANYEKAEGRHPHTLEGFQIALRRKAGLLHCKEKGEASEKKQNTEKDITK